MKEMDIGIPYFDQLFKLLDTDEASARAFGRHVHWGYWEAGSLRDGSVDAFVAASDRLTSKTLAVAELHDGMRILDAGCGFGGTLQCINEAHHNCVLKGINVDSRQVERARSQVQPVNGNEIEFIEMDANDLRFDQTFDLVLAVECIFHFDRPRFLGTVASHLEDRGRLVITDFTVNRRLGPLFRLLDFLTRRHTLATYGDIDISYSVERYREVAAAVGLPLEHAVDISRNTIPTYDFVLETIEKVPDRVAARSFRKATRGLQLATKLGLLGYQILSFRRREEPS